MLSSIIARIKGNRNLSLIIKGSGVNTIAKSVATVLGFVISVLITRHYGADTLGLIATLSSMLTLLTTLSLLGNQTYVLKLIPQQIQHHGYATARGSYHKVLKLLLICIVLVLSIYYVVSTLLPSLIVESLRKYQLLLFTIVALTVLKRLNTKVLRALGDFKIFSLMEMLPALFTLFAVLISLQLSVEKHLFIYLYYLPHLLVLVISFVVIQSMFEKHRDGQPINHLPSYSAMLAVSVPMFGITISNTLISAVDILMINHFTSESLAGIYSIYVKVATLPTIVISAINAMFAPRISAMNAAGQSKDLKRLTKQTTILSFSANSAACLVLLATHQWFFSIYGDSFNDHLPAFYMLLCSMVIHTFFGSVGFSLSMSGLHNQFFVIMSTAAVINIVANYLLIPQYGLSGAAFATLITVFYWNAIAALVMKKHIGYTPIFFDILFTRRSGSN